MIPLIILMVILSFGLAIGVGSNDESFATVIGSKRLSIRQAVVIGSIIIIVGSLVLGGNVSKTINQGIAVFDITTIPEMILSILISTLIIMIVGSYFGIPLSSTHAVVGSVFSLTIFIGGIESLNIPGISTILLGWILSPILGLIGAYLVSRIIQLLLRGRIKGFEQVRKKEYFFANLLLVFVCITAFSRAANDVSNAIAPIVGYYQDNSFPSLPLLLGGIGMALGLLSLGPRVLKTMSQDLVELNAEIGVSIQFSMALVLLLAALLGLPISGSHVQIASFVGVSLATHTPTKKKTLLKIVLSAIFTPVIAAGLAIGSYSILSLIM